MALSMFRTTLLAGALTSVAAPRAWAAEVRGTLQGIDALQPSPPPPLPERLRSYWEEQNGALALRPPHINPERDLALIVTGTGIAESNQPVDLPVAGARCQPGTTVVGPGTVLRVQNRDWMTHEFFATREGSDAPADNAGPEATAPNGTRQIQITAPGTYVLRDRLQPTFRCWFIVGPGQGRVLTPASDGAFRITGLGDGDYTLRVYFEGRQLAESVFHVANGRDAQVPAINLVAAPAASASNGSTSGGNALPSAGSPSGQNNGRRRRGR